MHISQTPQCSRQILDAVKLFVKWQISLLSLNPAKLNINEFIFSSQTNHFEPNDPQGVGLDAAQTESTPQSHLISLLASTYKHILVLYACT